jgi:hypothetical protein
MLLPRIAMPAHRIFDAAAPLMDELPSLLDHNSHHERAPNTGTIPVSDTVSVVVDHRLGKAEAIRRLKEGCSRINGHLGPMVAVEQETWDGDTLHWRMRALGQSAEARIEVLEDALRIEVSLPWLLAKAANRILPGLRNAVTLLLQKK